MKIAQFEMSHKADYKKQEKVRFKIIKGPVNSKTVIAVVLSE